LKQGLNALSPETKRCLRLALYWPVYGLLFYAAEQWARPGRYHVMYCWLDSRIPFCEWFILPYLFWFIYLIGIHLYTLRHDKWAFQRLMRFIILSYSIALIIFFLYPNCQLLRPHTFPRDNILVEMVKVFYRTDTNTNVCPSLHVVGSMAVWYAARDTKLFERRGWRLFFHIATLLVCVSTVFLKQHSVIDLLAGFGVSALCRLAVDLTQEGKELPRLRRTKGKLSY